MNTSESVCDMQERVESALLDVDTRDIDRDMLVDALKADRLLFRNFLRSFRHRLDLMKTSGG